MGSILVINAAGRETRVALVESGHIAEFYLERKKDKGVVGNIYKGRVVRVLPGMQAAFVDIGLEKAAFLYVSDVVYDPDFARAQFELTEGEHEDQPEVPEEDAEQHEDLGDVAARAVREPSAEGPGMSAESATQVPFAELSSPEREAPAPEAGSPDDPELEVQELEVRELAPGDLPPPAGGQPPRSITEPEMAAVDLSAAEPAAFALAFPSGSLSAEIPSFAPVHDPALESVLGAVELAPAASPVETSGELRAPSERGERPPREAREPREPRDPEARAPERHRNRHERKDRKPDGRQARERDEEKPKALNRQSRIEDLLKVGQEVVVQISKDPIGTKGARLTSHISIPGRHLVFMPTVDHVGISRRIGNEKERRRLRDIVDRLRPAGTGFIVRTVAENVPQEKLESDIRFLLEIWNQVVRRNEKKGGAGLMHPDLDLILRATRDLFAQDVEKLVVDDREEYERIQGFVNAQDPALKDRVVFHDSDEPVFDAYGIEHELNRATQRKVWLRSGGYLIMDQAEALTAIDVNSGRYVGKKSLEETITKINMEAAKEIVYQLRLRNIGGIIICDFIDMEKSQNRDKVFKALQEALGRDKAKTNVLRISELGLVEMTRKRVRESIGRVLHEDCSYCDGQGFVKTATTVTYEIFREIRREAPLFKDPTLVINCNSEVAKLIQGDERLELRHLMDRFNKSIQVKVQQNYHREQYDLYGRTAQGTEHKFASSSSPRRTEPGDVLPPPPAERRDKDNHGRRDEGRDRHHGAGSGGGQNGGAGAGQGGGAGGNAPRGRDERGRRDRGGKGRDRGDRNGGGDRPQNPGARQAGPESGGGNRGDRPAREPSEAHGESQALTADAPTAEPNVD